MSEERKNATDETEEPLPEDPAQVRKMLKDTLAKLEQSRADLESARMTLRGQGETLAKQSKTLTQQEEAINGLNAWIRHCKNKNAVESYELGAKVQITHGVEATVRAVHIDRAGVSYDLEWWHDRRLYAGRQHHNDVTLADDMLPPTSAVTAN